MNRELVKKTKELEYLSYHDHLTKAFNRKYLDEFAISDFLNQNNIFISYGIVYIKDFPQQDFEDLIKYAEDLMYKSKMEKKTDL